MNLALHLERAGRNEPQRPALGRGACVLRNYREVAGRVARLAGALRRFGLAPGERVVIAAKNSPDYVETLYAIWHAGFAAVPVNAKLHGAELGYIIEQSGARVCFASEGLDSEIAPHAPASLERMIVIGGAEYEQMFAADPIAVVPRENSDLAWLF
jgi:long-chain acyl-CoA synthetase